MATGKQIDFQIAACKKLIEKSVEQLKDLNVNVSNYLLLLTAKYSRHDDAYYEEKETDIPQKDDDMLSLLADINGEYEYGACKKGHPLNESCDLTWNELCIARNRVVKFNAEKVQ